MSYDQLLGREWQFREAVLAVLVAGNFAQLGAQLLLGPLVPAILVEFVISKSEIGLALTGMWAVYALFQFPSGLLAQLLGKPQVIVTSLTLTGLGGVLLAFAPEFRLFRVFVILLGVGTGLYLSVAGSLLTGLFNREGQALGFVTAGGAFAGLVAPLVASFVVSRYDWRQAILVWTAIPLAVSGAFAYLMYVSGRRRDVGRGDGESVDVVGALSVLTLPTVLFTIIIAGTTMFTWQSLASFLPTFFTENMGLSTAESSAAFGLFFLCSATSQPILGRCSDRFGRDAVLLGCVVVATGALRLLLLGPTLLQLIPVAVALGIGCGWAGVVQARFMDRLSDANRGPNFGLVRSVYLSLGSLGSWVTGSLADVAGWPAALGLLSVTLLATAGLLVANRALETGL